jgi:hypothetical protein
MCLSVMRIDKAASVFYTFLGRRMRGGVLITVHMACLTTPSAM